MHAGVQTLQHVTQLATDVNRARAYHQLAQTYLKTDKEKMNFITRIMTVGLAIVTAVGYYFLLRNGNAAAGVETFLTQRAYDGEMAWLYGIVIVICYTAGSSLVMWLAERINEKGIGNGISLILFANIIASVPSFVYAFLVQFIFYFKQRQNFINRF